MTDRSRCLTCLSARARKSNIESVSDVREINIISPIIEVCGARIGDCTPFGSSAATVGSFSLTTCLAL